MSPCQTKLFFNFDKINVILASYLFYILPYMTKQSLFSIMLIVMVLVTVLTPTKLSGQTTLQLKISPIGMHFFNEPNKNIYENKIDANSIFVLEPCIILGVETYLVSDILCFRANFGGLSDAISKPGLFLQAGLKVRMFQIYRNSLSFGAGLMLYGHECWGTVPNYEYVKGWKQNGSWEYSVGFLADLEYAIFLNDKNDLLFNFTYGYQKKTFNITIGYRYWLSSIIKHPIKCGSCPFTKTNNSWKK